MAEWNSAPYFPIDLKGLCALYALSPDAGIRAAFRRAPSGGSSRSWRCRATTGCITASQGRSYEHTLRPGRTLELSAHRAPRLRPRLVSDGASTPCRSSRSASLEHGLAIDPKLAAFADHSDDRRLRMALQAGRERHRRALSLQDPATCAMGSHRRLPLGRVGLPGDGAAPAPRRAARSADLDQSSGRGDPQRLWPPVLLGRLRDGPARAPVPRPRGARFRRSTRRSPTSPMPGSRRPRWTRSSTTATASSSASGKGLCLLAGERPPSSGSRTGPTAGCEVRLPGRRGRWIVRLSDLAARGQPRGLRPSAFRPCLHRARRHDRAHDPDYGEVACGADGVIRTADGVLDPDGLDDFGRTRHAAGGRLAWRCPPKKAGRNRL